MRIIFFGSSAYSVEILRELLNKGYKPVLAVTQPAKRKGRGLKLIPTEVKHFCLENNLNVTEPCSLSDDGFISLLKEKRPDLYIVVAYGKILPQTILGIPAVLPLCVHPSLLPKYRGAAPINWVLINGDKETGVTLFKMDKNMDSGQIIAQDSFEIAETDDFLTLSEKIYDLSKKVLTENLLLIKQGKLTLKPQRTAGVSFAPKIDKEMAKINWQKPAESIRNLVRGLVSVVCAWSYFREKRIRFWQVSAEEDDCEDCEIGAIAGLSKDWLKIKTGKGGLLVHKLQPEGRKVMSIGEFINGYHPRAGEKFS